MTSKSNTFKPDFSLEARLGGHVAGLDEAGRGPLAGPVVAAAVILNPDNIPDGLNDSKLLSQTRREQILNAIYETCHIGIGIAQSEEIDRLNILWASMTAMQRAFVALPVIPDAALIDGNRCPDLPVPAHAVVKGDRKCLSIAAASIVAKVTRDRLMKDADARYPGYGLAGHKGYPTAAHRAALITLGPSPIHRYSYKPVQIAAMAHKI